MCFIFASFGFHNSSYDLGSKGPAVKSVIVYLYKRRLLMRLTHAGEVGVEPCIPPSSDRAVAWSITARFVLGYLSVAWERGRSAVA